MNPSLNELLRPLSETERQQVDRAVVRLFANEDFQLVFRKMNQTCGTVLGPAFTKGNGSDAILAASLDGTKAHVRWLFDTYISSLEVEEKKPTEQIT